MPYKQVHSPTLGMNTTTPSTELKAQASPFISGVYIKYGEIISDFGHVKFPTPGDLKTNAVAGIPLMAKQFQLLSGVSHLVVWTTTNSYEYNTTTTTWDNITRGVEVDNAESLWTANTNVTTTNDTGAKLRGSKSVKINIEPLFTTGVAAYLNFGAKDLSAYTAAHFWVYSNIVTSAGDISLRYSEQNAGGSGATYVDFAIPALVANTWTPFSVTGGLSVSNAVLSIALIVNVDLGSHSIFLDDMRAVKVYTGTADNLWSAAILNDTLISTNGVDQPQKYLGVLATGFEDLTTTLNVGSITTSEIVFVARDHVLFCNNTENAADAPQRASWSNIGQTEDYINGTAGYQDLVDDESWIITVTQIAENSWVLHKEKSIVLMEWVGGHTPFRFTTMVTGKTVAGKNAVFSTDGIVFVIGTDVIYAYDGGRETQRLDISIQDHIFNAIDQTYIARAFVRWIEQDSEVQFWVPTTTEYPDTVYCYNVQNKNWFIRSRQMTNYVDYFSSSALTIGDLVGTIGEQNFTFGSTLTRANTFITLLCDPTNGIMKLDSTTLNNNGSAITNEFQTPDFLAPDTTTKSEEKGNMQEFFRVPQLIYDAKGQSITTEYSEDGGATWKPTQGSGTNVRALVSTYDTYQQDMDAVIRKIRFRFRNTTASSGFTLRYYAFKYISRSTRR